MTINIYDKSVNFLIFFSVKTKRRRMSTYKFGAKKKSPSESESTPTISTSLPQTKDSIPEPEIPSKPVTQTTKSFSSLLNKYKNAGKTAVTTTSKLESAKSDQVPMIGVSKEVVVKDEEFAARPEFNEFDVAKRYQEMESLLDKVPEYEIVGAEVSVYNMEELASKNEAPQITEGDSSGPGSLGDPRMGVVENNVFCETCGEDNIQCTGHFGYIKLFAPIYNPLFAPLIPKVLSCICISCGELFLDEATIREKGILRYDLEKRLNILAEESSNHMCRKCQSSEYEIDESQLEVGEEKEKSKKDKKKTRKVKTKASSGSQINFIWNKDCRQIQAEVNDESAIKGLKLEANTSGKKQRGLTLPIEQVHEILKAIKEESLELMGFEYGHRPSSFIMEYLPVIPPVARQPNYVDGGLKDDKLTEQYKTIITKNKALGVATKENRENAISSLFDEIDKFVQGTESSKKGVFKSIKERLQGKEERIRGTIMGRRVNFSARTVLGPKPSLRFGQIALPRVWAKSLRIQELVCVVNQKKLQKFLKDGKIHFIFPCDTKYKGLPLFVNDKVRANYVLQLGDNIERELMDGDYTIFNRQPTLHKQSMMGYQVVLHDELTNGMHISTTRPHNADFDGDEGNINQISSFDSRSEVQNIMNVKECIMNSQTNRPIMGLAFDSITGSYQLTSDDTKFTKAEFYQLLMAVTRQYDLNRLEEKGKKYGLITFDDKGQPLYSGKLLFSATLPIDFYYESIDNDNVVIIKEGIMISGRLSAKTIGSAHNSIIQALYKFYPRYEPFLNANGDTEVVKFITDATFLMDRYLAHVGFSLSIEDCILDEKSRAEQEKQIENSFSEALRAAYKISNKVENPLEEERRESQIKRYLDSAKAVGGEVSKLAKKDNTLLAMIKSGAKGSETNFSQIGSMLGQMFYKGNRFPLSITNQTRSSPYFEPNSLDIRSRGFVVNSFLTGLTPSELFFSQASGRLGLMDTALKTADVGDMHRRMVKIMEDIRIAYDGTVRNNRGRIFQFVYGDDGMDPKELHFVSTANGNVPMFVDVFKEARRINAKYSSE